MILTTEQREAMLEASRLLMKWLSNNCHPHCEVRVTANSAELLEGIANTGTDEFIKD